MKVQISRRFRKEYAISMWGEQQYILKQRVPFYRRFRISNNDNDNIISIVINNNDLAEIIIS